MATARIATSAVMGAAGIVLLAGCAQTAADPVGTAASSDATAPSAAATESDASGNNSGYTDGTYSAEGSYLTPRGTAETIDVTVTLASGIVTSVDVTGNPQSPDSKQYQSMFIGGIADEVVGKSIDDLHVGIVSGSSLTSGGFTEAIDAIKAEAAS